MSVDAEVAKLVGRFAAMRQLAARAAREHPQNGRARFGAAMALRISGDYRAAGPRASLATQVGMRSRWNSAKCRHGRLTMPPPEPGKRYLIVFCKRCDKGFRVVDQSIGQSKHIRISGPRLLKCRGCGHEATYEVRDMRMTRIGANPA